MKAIRIIALLLTLCMFASLLLACNVRTEPTESEAPSDTEAPSTEATDKATEPVLDSDLEYFIEVTEYNGKEFDEYNIDIGQESVMHVVKDTSPEEFEEFKSHLETEGFVLYTTNEIGNNKFATYITQTQILNVMLIRFDYDESNKKDYGGRAAVDHYEVRVMEDNRFIYDLPGLKEDNTYTNKGLGSFTMISDDAISYPGRMGYVYQLADGSFFIIDGGMTSDTPSLSAATALMGVLEEYAPDPNNIVIAGWLFTHIHNDHIGAYYDISRNPEYLEKLTVEKLIYNMSSEEELAIQDKYSWNGTDVNYSNINSVNGMLTTMENMVSANTEVAPQEIYKAHPGQVFYIRDLEMTIYMTQDLLMYSTIPTAASPKNLESINWHNSTSIVSMIKYQGKDMLFLADAHVYSIHYLLNPVYRTDLKADVLQVAHHGYADTRSDLINKYIEPEYVLWPARRGHYDGMNTDGVTKYQEGGKNYTGVATLKDNAVFTNDPSITQVYHEKDCCVTVDRFDSAQWNFYEWDAVP